MAFINLAGFSGVYPRTGPTNLAPNQAQVARNLKLQSGEIRPWREPALVYTPVTPNIKSIYQFKGPDNLSPIWLTWTTDVDVVAGPVADTADYRLYYTGSGTPKKTNWNLATGNGIGTAPYPNNYYEMGVPSPTAAPSLSASGGTAPTETRAYVYTYVSVFGSVLEESAPSPAATVTCNSSGSTVVIDSFTNPPTGNYNFQYKRIYRTVTGSNTSSYQLVAQIPIAQSSYSDSLSVTQLGIELPSLYFTPPPSDLKGLVSMPNGILAGFTGNQIWFCEPYLPHAWPATYMLTTEFPIVGLGVFGNTLFVGTTKNPYLVSGTTPGSMAQEKLSLLQPCISKRSITSDQFGLMYASPNGIVAVGTGMQDVVTTGLFTRDEWVQLLPETMIGAIYNNLYLGFYKVGDDAKTIVVQRGDNPPLVELDDGASAVFIEHSTGSVYILGEDNKIYRLDSDTVNNKAYEWKSKKFVLPSPINMGALKVQADFDYLDDTAALEAARNAVIASNNAIFATGELEGAINEVVVDGQELNGSLLQNIPTAPDNRYINIVVYADGVPVFTTSVTSQEPVRMPAGYKAYVWEVLFSGNVPLREFHMASTIGELRALPNG